MKLSEKILFCRKRAGLSQEALAELIGVSRQSVSKWETGDAAPETGKLLPLSKALGVTVDWLLAEDEPEPEPEPEQLPARQDAAWVEAIPGVIGKLIRRYGWLYGVYTALAGVGFIVIGTLAKVMTRGMFSSFPFEMGNFQSESVWYDEAGRVISDPLGPQLSIAANNPVSTMGTVIIVIGAVFIVAGIILAVCLKKGSGDR